MAMPQHKDPAPVGHEIYNLDRYFLDYYYYIISQFVRSMLMSRKEFWRNTGT